MKANIRKTVAETNWKNCIKNKFGNNNKTCGIKNKLLAMGAEASQNSSWRRGWTGLEWGWGWGRKTC